MDRRPNADTTGGWTRGALLRGAFGGGAVLAGGAALGAATGGSSVAAPTRASDARILRVFLTLERAQEAFYRAAIDGGRLDGPLLEFAEAAADQEAEHAERLRRRLGARARRQRSRDLGDSVATPEAFQRSAIDFEEAVLAVYVGQTANLSDDAIVDVCTLVSVEARQAAWIRDIAKELPAPRAADRARSADRVLAELRRKGLVA